MTAVILTYLVLSIEPMVRCMLRRISDAGIFYCSENSLQCYNESAEPTAERIVRIRSMQPGAREWLTRATHRAQHPVLRAGAGVSSPSTLFLRPTGCRRLVDDPRQLPQLYFTHPPSLYNNIYLRLQSTEDTAQGLCLCVYWH